MVDKTNIARILSKDTTQTPPENSGAFAPEIPSNEYVVGNLISKSLYNVTPEKDNGYAKQASWTGNKYLEKIAGMGSWTRALGKDLKKAGPLAHITLGTSMLGTGLSIKRTISSTGMAKRDMERSQREKNSLKALHGINKSLTTNQLDPSAMAVQRPKGM